ncbi:MAG: hypothetical protein HYX38_30025 [Rhodospirillales bacterium]|nr:hypothetical protein [Rhodospirillales bacterium]
MPTALPAPARSSVLAAALLVMACDGFHAGHVSAGGAPAAMARGIDQAYARRDACLARNATERALAGASVHARAQALALACASETDRLIFASSHGDAAIAGAIRDDTEFRALGVVLRAPGAD